MARIFPPLALAAVLAAAPACSLPAPKHDTGARVHEIEFLDPTLRTEVLRTHMHEMTVSFTGVIEKSADAIKAGTSDSTVYRNALRWKIQAVPEVQLAGLRMEPVGALLDLWSLCEQMHHFFTEGAGVEAFGEHQSIAVAATERMLADVAEVARAACKPGEFAATERRMKEWAAANPVDGLTLARDTIISDFAEHAGRSADVFGSLGTIEEVALAGEKSVSIMAASLPRQARWQAELVQHDLFRTEEMEGLLAAADELSELSGGVPALVDESLVTVADTARAEREAAIAELRAERELVLADVERQRLETLGVVTALLEEEMRVTRELLTAERNEALREVERLTAATVADLDRPIARAVDRLVVGLALLGVAGLILLPLVLRIGRRAAFGPDPRA